MQNSLFRIFFHFIRFKARNKLAGSALNVWDGWSTAIKLKTSTSELYFDEKHDCRSVAHLSNVTR